MKRLLFALLVAGPLSAQGTLRVVVTTLGPNGTAKVDTISTIALKRDTLVIHDTVTVRITTTVVVHDTIRITQPPVVAGSEPVFDSASATLVYRDNMDSYVSGTAMGERFTPTDFKIVPNPSPFLTSSPVLPAVNQVIAPGRGGVGKALRLAFPGNAQSAANYSTTYNNLGKIIQPLTATHYFSYWARVNISTTPPPAGSPNGPGMPRVLQVKWFMVWHSGSSGRVQWDLQSGFVGSKHENPFALYDQAGTPTQGKQPVGPYLSDLLVVGPVTPNQPWHRFTYAYRPNSVKGARDGFARMWIDGVKMLDVSAATVGVTPPGGEKPWCTVEDVDGIGLPTTVSQVVWGSVQTVSTSPWTLDFDDFIWWWTP